MADVEHLADPTRALIARATAGERSPELARAMEDLLCDGYATCLQIDSRIRRLERRRADLLIAGLDGNRDDLRKLEERQEILERSAADTRHRLGALRACFVGLGGGPTALRAHPGGASTSPCRIA